MSTFKKFEDIDAWKQARVLTKSIYQATGTTAFYRDRGLKDQMRRASVSVMSNIAEGFDRGGKKEFIQFLSIAKGSIGEVKSQLYVAYDQQYVDQNEFDRTYRLADTVGSIIHGLMRYLSSSDITGLKRKPGTIALNRRP